MNLTMFLAAGFETVYNALNYCFYVLATHPEEMKKLQDEIDTFFKDESVILLEFVAFFIDKANIFYLKDQINYENINNMEYIDLFIKEVLRMYPIAIQYLF